MKRPELAKIKSATGPECGNRRGGFVCTRDKGHTSTHLAHGFGDVLIAAWDTGGKLVEL